MQYSRFGQRQLNFALLSAVSIAAISAIACSSDPGCESCSAPADPSSAGAASDLAPPFLLPRETAAGAPNMVEPAEAGAGGMPSVDPEPEQPGGNAGAGGAESEPDAPIAEAGAGGEVGKDVAEPEPEPAPEPVCGDRLVDPGEECDDGNASNDDECTAECRRPACGDGFAFLRLEQCDDANDDDTDACRNDCTAATCGDGVVQAGVEECDDENSIETDDCLSNCKAPRCGDAVVQTGKEECDDANTTSEDACLDCKLAKCGDGNVWQGREECDDGHTENGDGCSKDCTAEPVAVSLGYAHTCAVLGDRRLKCWGDNTYGQVGPALDSTVGDEQSELGANLKAVLDDVDAVAAGYNHTCALQGGAVQCWGGNGSGQLGPGSSATLSEEPVPVAVGGHATALCATSHSSFALLADGSVRGWGVNYNESRTGVWNAPFGTGVRAIACGTAAVCALSNRGVECWGTSKLTSSNPTPMSVSLGSRESSEVVQFSPGASHACAVFANGKLYCWGSDLSGQRLSGLTQDLPGDVSAGDSWYPAPLSMTVKMVASGGGMSCAIGTDGARDVLKCWGYDTRTGALGQPDWTAASTNHIGDTEEEVTGLLPIQLGTGLVPRIVATSGFHTCAILTNGGMKCWGDNGSGQLGIGTDDSAIGDNPGEMGDSLRYASVD